MGVLKSCNYIFKIRKQQLIWIIYVVSGIKLVHIWKENVNLHNIITHE